jgi:uncharacterized membrane protein YkoI
MSQGQAQAAAQAGQVLPLGALVGQIQQALGGKIVDSRLCQRSGRLVYELSVLVAGQVRKLTVDAAGGGY